MPVLWWWFGNCTQLLQLHTPKIRAFIFIIMVEFIKTKDVISCKMVITIEQSSIDDLQSMQNALISALVEFNRNKDLNFESESYYLAEILKSLQPDIKILETGFNRTPESEFLRIKRPLNIAEMQKIQRTLYEIYETTEI